MTEGVNKITPREKEKSEALKRKVSGGTVVPAVGKSEGATPRRMECIAIKKPKIYIEKKQSLMKRSKGIFCRWQNLNYGVIIRNM